MAEIRSRWKHRRRQYKVYVTFQSSMPFIVEAYSANKAIELALKKARECAADNETLEAGIWHEVDRFHRSGESE